MACILVRDTMTEDEKFAEVVALFMPDMPTRNTPEELTNEYLYERGEDAE